MIYIEQLMGFFHELQAMRFNYMGNVASVKRPAFWTCQTGCKQLVIVF